MIKVRNKRMQIKREVQELALLFDISQTLNESMDIKEVILPVLNVMSEHMGMIRGTLSILNRETGEIFIEAACGLSNKEKSRGKYKVGEGVTGKVVKTGKPAVIPSISNEPLFLNRTMARQSLEKKDISFICVPIKIGTEVIGTLSADRLFSEEISLEEDVRLLSIIAHMIAQTVRLHQASHERMQQLQAENTRLHEELKDKYAHPENIIGKSRNMQMVYALISQVAPSNTTVLITGESGVGKERVAEAIYAGSLRNNKPFIKVNCSAFPESMIESELFGHEKGAFTGAISMRKGRFELADGGTIFLDEIGDLSLPVQVKLLRVLQEREFERLGSGTPIKVDVRIIAATNRNLEDLIRDGKFREDLYYRLNVFPITIPPLRQRESDIPLLADFFVEKYNKLNQKNVRRISTPAIDMLMSYHWPGNVRELENCIERAVVLSTDRVIHGYHLPPTLQTAEASGTGVSGTLQEKLDNYEREFILEALKNSKGNMADAARVLGLSERKMRLRIAKYMICPKRFKRHS